MEKAKYWSIALIVIIGVFGVTFIAFSDPTYYEQYYPDPTLTVNGQFDRVELMDRHYGDWNGLEVVDEQVAVIYANGSVPIAQTHYEGSYAKTRTNFGFLLRIYWGVDHLEEEIDVMGGASEEYVYLNITIVVSLGFRTTEESFDNTSMALLVASTMVTLVSVIAWSMRPGRNDSNW